MQKFITKGILIFTLSASSIAALAENKTDQDGYLKESRQTAQAYMQALGGTLKTQLETAGAESAISVCKHVAPALAADYSKDGWTVKRVSLKARNKSLGVPDAWEQAELESFDSRHRDSEPATGMEVTAVVEEADGRWFRYLKAIPTQAMCLQCHGKPDEIPAGVKALLAKEYPEDGATGYSEGEIRGAISIKRRWPDKES